MDRVGAKTRRVEKEGGMEKIKESEIEGEGGKGRIISTI